MWKAFPEPPTRSSALTSPQDIAQRLTEKQPQELGVSARTSSNDVHLIIIDLVNRPGLLAKILIVLQHHSANIENARVDAIEGTKKSTATLGVSVTIRQLEAIQRKIGKIVGVLSVEATPSPISQHGERSRPNQLSLGDRDEVD